MAAAARRPSQRAPQRIPRRRVHDRLRTPAPACALPTTGVRVMHPIVRSRKTWLALALAAATGAAVAQDTLTAAEVRATLEAQGYTNVNDVEFDDGMWEADARSADGNRVDVRLDPATGRIYADDQVATLGESDIKARLAAAGYGNVHDVKFDDGVWKAEADDQSGREVDLRLDPDTGEIIGADAD